MKELKPEEYLEYENNYFRKFDEYLQKKVDINKQEKSGKISEKEAAKLREDLVKNYSGFTDPIQDSNCFCYITKELEQLYLESGAEISENFKSLLEDSVKFSGQRVKMQAGLEGTLLGTATSLDDFYYVIQDDSGKVIFDTGCDGILEKL